MDIVDIIRAKRDDRALSPEEIRWFITQYTHVGSIADEQASALLMAIYFNGLDAQELATWTDAMINSGERLDLSSVDRPTIDKHSTGGVGDKLSLIVVPILAACGAAIPQLSGRGLGHTGGTLDKMEAISGWRSQLSTAEMLTQLDSVGAVIAGASDKIAPADKLLLALRDVTGTIESIPLIASSIMSKKIAEGTRSLLLDVKVGRGGFFHSFDEAERLAHIMVGLGDENGVRTTALLTDMDCVIGRAVGNGLEVQEALDVLGGDGPEDVTKLAIALAREMARLAGVERTPLDALESGDALRVFEQMVAAQSGSLAKGFRDATLIEFIGAESSGFVNAVDPYAVGVAAWRLGAGRSRKEDPVNPAAGVICMAKPGEEVERGQPIFALHGDDRERMRRGHLALEGAVSIGEHEPPARPLVFNVVGR